MENFPPISRVIHRVMVPVIFVLGMAMFLVVMAQVIFRYLLLRPLPWSEELSRYLMVWGACLAASEAYAGGNHVGVTIIINAIKPGMRKIMTMVIHLVVAVLMAVIVYQGFVLSFLLHDQRSPALEIPMTVPYLAVPAGAGLILIQAVVLFFKQMSESPTDATIHSELE